jgi:phospholipid transport system substrate-binding protein
VYRRHPGASARIQARAPQLVAILGVATLLMIATLSGAARATTDGAADPIRQFYDVLLSNMQNGPSLGPKGRYDRLEPVIQRDFDLNYMTRVAVGPPWSSLTDGERQQVTNAFGRYIAATYAERFDSYAGQKLQVTGEQPRAAGVIVDSRIVRAGGAPVTIRYLMRQDGDAWRIADIYLSGTISEVAVHRSEFSSIIDRQGVPGLIAMLNQKADMLVASEGN